jgi:archaemetzincin
VNRREWLVGCAGSVLLGWSARVLGEPSAPPTPSAPGPAPSASPTPPEKLEPLLVVQPLGTGMSPVETDYILSSIRAFFAFRVALLAPIALPRAAYYPKRQRYRAEKLLDTLRAQMPPDALRVLGVTHVDISTTKDSYEDWGIMGLADSGGLASVVSTFRCKRGAKNPAHARIRLGKVAVHEFGHTLGLDHCPTLGCLLEDAGGTATTLERETDLCSDCRKRLVTLGYPAKDMTQLPWK